MFWRIRTSLLIVLYLYIWVAETRFFTNSQFYFQKNVRKPQILHSEI